MKIKKSQTRHIIPLTGSPTNQHTLCGLARGPVDLDSRESEHTFVIAPRKSYRAYCEKLGDKACDVCAERWVARGGIE